MKTIEMMTSSKQLLSCDDLTAIIDNIGLEINMAYSNLNPVILIVMNGGFVFGTKLVTSDWLRFPLEVDFCRISRYDGPDNAKEIEWLYKPNANLENRHIIVVDDIFDTGHTLNAIYEELAYYNPLSIKSAVLLNKKSRNEVDFQPDYVGKEIDDLWVFGFGMDRDNQDWRQLNEVRYKI